MKVSTEVKHRVEMKLRECIDTAIEYYNIDVDFPKIEYKKCGTTAGTANYCDNVLNFNPVLLMQNVESFIARTVPHEMAHLLTDIIDPTVHMRRAGKKRQPHGALWQSVMRVLGANPSRCHSYDVSSVQRKSATYDYKCSGCGKVVQLGVKRHNKFQAALKQGRYIYSHSGCNRAKLVWVNDSHQPVRAIAADAPKRQTTKRVSKKAASINIYKDENGIRADVIRRMLGELGMTPAGASTYYNNIRKGTWA